MTVIIAVDDPRRDDVRALVARHLAFANEMTPPAHVHALGDDDLTDPAVTLFGARLDGALVAIAALRELDPEHGEVKSMHTAVAARRLGVGSAMLDHLVLVARQRGYRHVSLETGTTEAFEPARSLYATRGFVRCEPFGEYTVNEYSVCMTLALDGENA
jgi:putative acetyltransferase